MNAKPAAALVLICLLTTVSRAQDWPQWRGPNRDAKVTGFEVPKTWPHELTQKWRTAVGSADTTPALVGNKLYVFSRVGDEEVLQCLDAGTGNVIWSDKYESGPATGPSASHPGPRSSPTVAEGKVVTLGVRGTISCLDADTGKLLWRKNDYKGWPQFYTSMSPIILNGACIADVGGKTNGTIVAYDLATGEEKWKWTGDAPGYDSPVILDVGGSKLVLLETEKKIVALDPATGVVAWQSAFAPKGMGQNCETPIVDGDILIYTGANRGTVAVKLQKQGDTLTSQELWSNPDNSPQFATPVLKNGLIFGLASSGNFYCIDEKTGKTDWTETDAKRGGFGSIVDAGDVLLALTPKSQLIAFQPSDKGYSELASIKVSDAETYAYPIISGKRVFIQDREGVTLWTLE